MRASLASSSSLPSQGGYGRERDREQEGEGERQRGERGARHPGGGGRGGKKKLPEDIVEEFEKIKYHKDIIDGYSEIFKDAYKSYDNHNFNDSDLLLYFLRYKLGMQVKYVLEREDSCFMSCET